ncbi:MAG TPA: NAD-dependent succinate-semialdehyde dehydrogenase [Pyrinomonadaceae bacterium]|nr:NAD-dependent succinate-semialdehyde dehydrogenase [Pyrinomonadaceae bacterium]
MGFTTKPLVRFIMSIATVNPATNETLRVFEPFAEEEIEERVGSAHETFRSYRRTTFAERARLMMRAAEILTTEKDSFARLMTLEMGKPLASAVQEVEKCAWVCRFYAENAARFLADEQVETNGARSYVRYEPVGVVLAVMPWNFPFWQVFRFAAPALMAGNTALLKHASNVPQCALAIEEIFRRAGFPEGAFGTLLIGSSAVAALLEDARVAAATLTGSEAAGRSVAAQAGAHIKKTVLELGGSDPFIVMPSANLDEAVATAVKARTINNGQSCIAAKRFIVAEEVYDEFERGFVERMRALVVGDPLDTTTDIGPLATPDILRELDEQVRVSTEAGARILVGGRPVSRPGNFYAPTVLTNIPADSPAYREELFGPVALLFRAADIDDAIRIANDTSFGLGASAWTRDEREQTRFVEEIEAGQVFINSMVASDPRLPFGGVKNSGYGRELSAQGIREFVNIKTIWIKGEVARAENAATQTE